jgi:hypothetical protein
MEGLIGAPDKLRSRTVPGDLPLLSMGAILRLLRFWFIETRGSVFSLPRQCHNAHRSELRLQL